MANSSAFLQNHILQFPILFWIFLQLLTTGCLVRKAAAPLSNFNSRKPNIVLEKMFLPGKNYSIPTEFCPARARVSYSLLHKTPIVQNRKSCSMCLIGFSLRWHIQGYSHQLGLGSWTSWFTSVSCYLWNWNSLWDFIAVYTPLTKPTC